MSFWVNVKWLSNGYNLNGTTLVRNFCHSPFTFVLCSHRELWVASSFILYGQIKFLTHDSLSIIKLIKKWRKNNFFGKLKRWNLFGFNLSLIADPSAPTWFDYPHSFSIHFWEPVQTNLEKVRVSKTNTQRERERERERWNLLHHNPLRLQARTSRQDRMSKTRSWMSGNIIYFFGLET